MAELIQILSDWNPWWDTGSVPTVLLGKRRKYTRKLLNLLDAREVKALTGVRRSGKSTIFYQIIEVLLKERNIPAKNILLVNFEDEALSHTSLEEIFNEYETYFSPEKMKFLF